MSNAETVFAACLLFVVLAGAVARLFYVVTEEKRKRFQNRYPPNV